MISRRTLMQGSAALALGTGAWGVAWAEGKPGRVTMNSLAEPPTLQMAINTAAAVQVVSSKIHSGLLDYDGDFNKPIPDLAEKWEVSPDGKAITFHLRQGVQWHDGKPFTSEDVKFTIENVIKKYHSRGRVTFANLDAVETPDPQTAVFRLKAPAPYIMVALHSSETPIVPKHIYENTDILSNPNNNAPVGTGPYKFKEWKRGAYIILRRNENYYMKGEPVLDEIVFSRIPDAGARGVALESGELDIGGVWPVPLPDMQRFQSVKNVAITTEGYKPFGAMSFFEFNLKLPLFQDVRVRQAIAHCIDRARIVDTIYCGYGAAATGPINSKMPGGFYTDKVSTYKYDLKLAEKLLDEAGQKRGAGGIRFSFTIEPAPWNAQLPQMAEYMAQSLSRVGIKTNVDAMTASIYFPKRAKREFSFSMGGWPAPTPTAGPCSRPSRWRASPPSPPCSPRCAGPASCPASGGPTAATGWPVRPTRSRWPSRPTSPRPCNSLPPGSRRKPATRCRPPTAPPASSTPRSRTVRRLKSC